MTERRINTTIVIAGFLLSFLVAVGGFVYHEGARDAAFDNLEYRLSADETRFDGSLLSHETRLRALEQSTGERLARIETRLDSIESYIVAISDRLEVTMRR